MELSTAERITLLLALTEARENWKKNKPIQLAALIAVMNRLNLFDDFTQSDYDDFGDFVLSQLKEVS